MSRSPIPEMAESIDQVIQDGQTLSPGPDPRSSDTNVSINKTAPLSPLPSSPGNPRREHVVLSMQPNPQAGQDERRAPSRGKEKDGGSSKKASIRQSDEGSGSSRSGNNTTLSGSASGVGSRNDITDFFSSDVFQIVLHNPTTAHRFLRFCQSRACGENMEFLQKVDAYNRLLDEVTQSLSSIHQLYTSTDAPRQINIPHSIIKRVSADIKQTTQFTLPSLETIFFGAQEHVEKLLASDIYPRFVKHQVTAAATMALADHRERYQGLGDCFCMTDPKIADNPILFASDGFVSVTGYTRHDIIPRNCRFLQGELTDPLSTKRLKYSIDCCEETVELLLNYRKNGDPFWNLLYCSPLFNERGEVSFFLGGQINCSTTIHSCNDILKVLSINDDELDRLEELGRNKPPSIRSQESRKDAQMKTRSSFFKSWRKYNAAYGATPAAKISVREEPGMEGELINRIGKLNFRTQVEAFYTAYSKYLVMIYNPTTQTLLIQHYSPGIIDMLCLNLPNGSIAPIFSKDIFKVLSEHSSSSSSTSKAFKQTVRDALRGGKAVSVEIGLLTGYEERRGGRFGGGFGGGDWVRTLKRVEERYVTHWTPLKDEEGRVRWVVLTIAPKM